MERRVMGEEWETAIYTKKQGSATLSIANVEHIVAIIKSLPRYHYPAAFPEIGRWHLVNGDVLYVDTGGHLEFASRECLYAESLVASAKAGEHNLAYAIQRANASKELRETGTSLLLFKDNTDSQGANYGVHENYLVPRNKFTAPDRKLLYRIGWFLGTRMIFTGNGNIGIDRNGLFFSISQRINAIGYGVSSNTTYNRGIINTRDDMMNRTPNQRLHIIIGDATIFQAATFLKFGTTDLVLDMVEEGYLDEYPYGEFEDAEILEGLRVYASDPLLAKTFNGLRAVDRQEWYFERASRYYEEYGNLTDSRKRALRLWADVIQAARSKHPYIALSPIACWAAKFLYLRNDKTRFGYDYTNPLGKIEVEIRQNGNNALREERTAYAHVMSLNHVFDRIYPPGIALILEREGNTEQIVSEQQIAYAERNPFPETRAYPRGRELKWAYERTANGSAIVANASWEHVTIQFGNGQEVSIKHRDPFDTRYTPPQQPK